jgi:hypothetical protein
MKIISSTTSFSKVALQTIKSIKKSKKDFLSFRKNKKQEGVFKKDQTGNALCTAKK